MPANTNTPAFRLALSLALLWVLGISAYGLISGEAERMLLNRADLLQCASASDASPSAGEPSERNFCISAYAAIYSESDRIMRGNPALLVGTYVLLPPLVILWLVANGRGLLIALSSTSDRHARRYIRWIKGTSPNDASAPD
jgi:hypothetical protein